MNHSDLPMRLGEFRNMSFEDYLAVEAMSASGMREFARSPWHYRHRVPVVPTRPMLNGSLAHCAQLEPDALSARYIVVPDDAQRRPTDAQWNAKNPNESSRAAMAWWREFEQMSAGRQIVRAEDFAITRQQLAAILAEPYLAEFFSRGYAETSVFWLDPATGVYCKARPDWIQPVDELSVRMLELKTAADESPTGFGRSISSMGYHRARAHYIAGFQCATGLRVVEYAFACVTNKAPVLAVPYWLDEEDAQQGVDEVAELLERFAWCKREGQWPSYGSGPQIVGLPVWAKRSSEIEVEIVE